MSIPVDLGPLGDKILQGVKDAAGPAWDRFTEGERDLIGLCASDAAKATVMALTDPERARIIKKSIDAQLANIKVAGEIIAQEAASALVWKVVAAILEIAVPLLVKSVLRI